MSSGFLPGADVIMIGSRADTCSSAILRPVWVLDKFQGRHGFMISPRTAMGS